MYTSLASLNVTELLRPAPEGERVNSLVVPAVPEPQPDYETMRRLASGGQIVSSDDDEHFRQHADSGRRQSQAR